MHRLLKSSPLTEEPRVEGIQAPLAVRSLDAVRAELEAGNQVIVFSIDGAFLRVLSVKTVVKFQTARTALFL